MFSNYNKVHNSFKLNGHQYSSETLKAAAHSLKQEELAYKKAIGNFFIDWLNDEDFITVNTSGSTGIPKQIQLNKQAMVNSAFATGDYFKLQSGNTALHCLPSHFIAGKMMLVRALILGLEIDCVAPTTQPIFDYKKQYDFCAMIPIQVSNTLDYSKHIKTIIIGGASVSITLLGQLKNHPTCFYETYGMTETVTHVAIKALESQSQKGETNFKALPNIQFSKDERDCLIIDAPKLSATKFVTNDVVDLISEQSFIWKGRYDTIINSGGVKLMPEQIEAKLINIIKQRFIVASKPDIDLGEKLILIIEKPIDTIAAIKNNIKALKTLQKLEKPQEIYALDAFEETKNGKVQRQNTISKALV